MNSSAAIYEGGELEQLRATSQVNRETLVAWMVKLAEIGTLSGENIAELVKTSYDGARLS